MTAEAEALLKPDGSFIRILGVEFFTGNAAQAVDHMNRNGGLLVVPAAPALKDLGSNQSYREALINADCAITDSAFMVLIWNCINRDRVRRVSGLAYLRELLSRAETKMPGSTFWVMPNKQSAQRNVQWLQSQGLPLTPNDIHISPLYGREIADPELLAAICRQRPSHVIVAIGGGTQERLGLYLKRSLDFNPSIHCIGAAIAFLTGDQVRIPQWADRLWLGWMFRCVSDPRRYISRYWSARKLLPLLLRYKHELPGS